jgi:GxxExxY protein
MRSDVNLELPPAIEEVGRRVIGCAIEVHRHLGPGLLEKLYEDALVHELTRTGMSLARQVDLAVAYKDIILRGQRLDLIVEGCVVVELKAVAETLPVHGAQLLSYLRAADMPLGLLLNFNMTTLKDGIKRVCNERWSGLCTPNPD